MHLSQYHTIGMLEKPPRRRRRSLSRGELACARGSALRGGRRSRRLAIISLALLTMLALLAGA